MIRCCSVGVKKALLRVFFSKQHRFASNGDFFLLTVVKNAFDIGRVGRFDIAVTASLCWWYWLDWRPAIFNKISNFGKFVAIWSSSDELDSSYVCYLKSQEQVPPDVVLGFNWPAKFVVPKMGMEIEVST